jgi:hypothetical protein
MLIHGAAKAAPFVYSEFLKTQNTVFHIERQRLTIDQNFDERRRKRMKQAVLAIRSQPADIKLDRWIFLAQFYWILQ